ncbi:MAG TPA: homoserine kinase, partial [Thermoanaerobaculia bacterium]|nr:homoserine kinase [Thermoanaerobaculia bacterium]
IVRLRHPEGLRVVLVEPEQRLRTEEARAVLPRSVDRNIAVAQAANVGALVAALAKGDFALLGRAIEDRIAEPARAPLLPGFAEAKLAAIEAGAHGCSISGAGPAAFAFASDDNFASRVGKAMVAAYERRGIAARASVRTIDPAGARVVEG